MPPCVALSRSGAAAVLAFVAERICRTGVFAEPRLVSW